jgi:glutamyl-tRNA synthetase
MNQEIVEKITALITENVIDRTAIEAKYQKRALSEGALVTRIAPSPTGFVHIGTVYAALLCQRLAAQTGGIYFLRIEDTDKKREVAGGAEMILQALTQFNLRPQEGPEVGGAYGPYKQSERADIYMSFAIELLRAGRAYPCFATPEELEENTKKQQAAKVRPGYYGEWALWRNKSEEEVLAALAADKPFVLRFKSLGSHDKRVEFTDALKGALELPENDLDVPLIKSDEHRLPTYHLAHVVDDYLMQTNLVLRGDEWLPSTPLHIELAEALHITPFRYAHIAPISIIDKNGGGKRKLSKRKDPEADVQFWLKAGYPVTGVTHYLLGLASSSFEEWYRAHPGASFTEFEVTLQKLAASRAPLLDMTKLEDYCKDYIASLPQEIFEQEILSHAPTGFKQVITDAGSYAQSVFAIERSGEKPRKDLSKWEDAYDQYGYFFDSSFEKDFKVAGQKEYLETVSDDDLGTAKAAFLETYAPADTQEVWFEKLKAAAEKVGYAIDNKAFKANPEQFKGGLADFAKIIRVSLTGKNRTPDLYAIMQVMGEARVRSRLTA